MRRGLVWLVFILSFVACDTASNVKQPSQSYFLKYFGGQGNQTAVDLIINDDGTFYILGNSRASRDSIQKIYLAKADMYGQVIWQTTYGTTEMQATDFLLTSDGNYLMVTANNPNTTTAYLIRFTLQGIKNGSDEYQMPGGIANSVTELSDGTFIVEGAFTVKQSELHLRWFGSPWGPYGPISPVWRDTLSGGNSQPTAGSYVGVRVLQNQLGNMYVFGTTTGQYHSTNSHEKFWAYNLSNTGSPSTTGSGSNSTDVGMFEAQGYSSRQTLKCAIPAMVGGYIVAGISTSASADSLKVAITNSFDQNLNIAFNGVYKDTLMLALGNGTNDPFVTLSSSIQYNFILADKYNSTASPTSDILLMKVDNALKPLWGGGLLAPYVTFGGDGDDTGAAVGELPDGHIIVLGTMQLGNPPEQTKIALMKLNSSGKLAE